jgi:hypothetical protein
MSPALVAEVADGMCLLSSLENLVRDQLASVLPSQLAAGRATVMLKITARLIDKAS